MGEVVVTQELLKCLELDSKTDNTKTAATVANNVYLPTVLIVFANSDINAALYYLNKSLEAPDDPTAIATVLIQESIKDDFLEKLKLLFNKSHIVQEDIDEQFEEAIGTRKDNEPVMTEINDNVRNKQFVKALATAQKLNAKIITAKTKQAHNFYSPTLVCDFTHEQLGTLTPSGIVTLHVFRTCKEAISLVNKETLKFDSVSTWLENVSHAYELIDALKLSKFFVNCYQVPINVLEESIRDGKNYVCVDKNYHYETITYGTLPKIIVFPIRNIFAN